MPALQLRAMHAMGTLHVRIYRAFGGRVWRTMRGLPVLLLTVPGRRTGIRRTTPISYIRDGDRYVVTGSAGGNPAEPQWFRNLRATQRAEIEVGPARAPVVVEIAAPTERARLWVELVRQAPYYAQYQAKVEREIPMAVLTPTSEEGTP